MKGQVTVEELISFSIYLALLAMLIAAASGMREAGEEWSSVISLKAEAGQLARSYDSFYINDLHNPYNWTGGGTGYLELERGGLEATAPVLSGKFEVAEGEPV